MAGIGLASASLCAAEPGQPLDQGWEFYRGSLGSTWEIWRGEQATDNVAWSPVTLPHCFNARDAVDPDERYYQGPGWYRTHLAVANPFPGGRTLLLRLLHSDLIAQLPLLHPLLHLPLALAA